MRYLTIGDYIDVSYPGGVVFYGTQRVTQFLRERERERERERDL